MTDLFVSDLPRFDCTGLLVDAVIVGDDRHHPAMRVDSRDHGRRVFPVFAVWPVHPSGDESLPSTLTMLSDHDVLNVRLRTRDRVTRDRICSWIEPLLGDPPSGLGEGCTSPSFRWEPFRKLWCLGWEMRRWYFGAEGSPEGYPRTSDGAYELGGVVVPSLAGLSGEIPRSQCLMTEDKSRAVDCEALTRIALHFGNKLKAVW